MGTGSDRIESIVSEISARYGTGLIRGGLGRPQDRLASCVKEIDDFLEGGLPFGAITEFGVPMGKEGRLLVLKFVANATRGIGTAPLWTLWISSHETYHVFPPAWFARGVDPGRILFARSERPLRDLKQAIGNPIFRLIVLDSPRRFSREDCFYVNRQARLNRQLILLLRDFFLSNRRGNIWAGLRLNCWRRYPSEAFVIRVVRGLTYRELVLDGPAIDAGGTS